MGYHNPMAEESAEVVAYSGARFVTLIGPRSNASIEGLADAYQYLIGKIGEGWQTKKLPIILTHFKQGFTERDTTSKYIGKGAPPRPFYKTIEAGKAQHDDLEDIVFLEGIVASPSGTEGPDGKEYDYVKMELVGSATKEIRMVSEVRQNKYKEAELPMDHWPIKWTFGVRKGEYKGNKFCKPSLEKVEAAQTDLFEFGIELMNKFNS